MKIESILKPNSFVKSLIFSFFFLAAIPIHAKIKIAASLPDLGSIASSIGGDQVEVFSIAKSNANPHFVEVLPSFMIKVSRVNLFLKAGLGLDQWADAIIEGSRNNQIKVIDCSNGISVLEKPSGKVDASLGDVHPQGNPHYWLDAQNGKVIAKNIRDALTQADPSHAELYGANEKKFSDECDQKFKAWKNQMAAFNGMSVITYHSSWVYFTTSFGFKIMGYVEPFPGIPPTAKHLQELIETIKTSKAKILIQEPYYGDNDPKFLERATGIKIFRFTPSCENVNAGEYLKHFENIVTAITKEGIKP